jgi:hypothetical protein
MVIAPLHVRASRAIVTTRIVPAIVVARVVTAAMISRGLILLTAALDRYCKECNIVDEQERLYAGQILMSLFATGIADLERLVAGLYAALECERSQTV